MHEVYKRDLLAFQGNSLKQYRINKFLNRYAWVLKILAIFTIPFRKKNKKVISVLGLLSLSALSLHPLFI